MKTWSLKTKLVLLVSSAVLGLLAFGIVSFATLSKVEVGSPVYERIVMNKDVNARLRSPVAESCCGRRACRESGRSP